MDETQILTYILSSGGTGGAIAVLMFYFYRKDSIEWLRRYEVLNTQSFDISKDFKSVVQDNTRAITVLTERLK